MSEEWWADPLSFLAPSDSPSAFDDMPADKRSPEITGRPSENRSIRPGRAGADPPRELAAHRDPWGDAKPQGGRPMKTGELADLNSLFFSPRFASVPRSSLVLLSPLASPLVPFLKCLSLGHRIPVRSEPDAARKVAFPQKSPSGLVNSMRVWGPAL
jgi:hypothetical protein